MPTTGVSQEGRLLQIETPLGKDALIVLSLNGTEALSRPFEFQLELCSDKPDHTGDKLIGKFVTISILRGKESPRYIHGMVSRFSCAGSDERFTYYRMEVVPQVWRLSQTKDSRVFQDKTAPQIITKLFQDAGITDFKQSIKRTYTQRDYCIQYRESTLAFIARLMEEEGIFYFFEHEKGKHTLVLADTPEVHKNIPGTATIPYNPKAGPGEGDSVSSWKQEEELHPGNVVLRDYHFEMPSKVLEAKGPAKNKIGNNTALEVYEFPGGYTHRFNKPGKSSNAQKEGEDFVKLRMEAEEAMGKTAHGQSDCAGMISGYKFELKGYPKKDQKAGPFTLVSVTHSARQNSDLTSGYGGGGSYSNTFSCIPEKVPYRTRGLTQKAVIHGPQTAVVVGPKGEEVYTDKYGRIKVQFHWDREGKKDENSSCWCRVAQMWAGKQWGAQFLPRIGHEVLVAFIDGDPDAPIIVGSLYNAENLPPYELPAKQTQSGIKTRSTKEGSASNFNELRFEDKKGSEEVYFHAEKDFKRVVENDDTLNVGHDQTEEIKNHRTTTIKEGNDKLTLEKGNSDTTLKMGNRSATLEMGNDSLVLKMGNQTTKLDLGKSETEALQSIELKVGQSSIKIDQAGVTIKGMVISIDGQVQTEVKGLMVQVTGQAMLQAKGAVTMLG